MSKIRLVVISLGIAMILPFVPALQAQAPAAPIPLQILTAKKVFISNAGAGPDRVFNQFYMAIKNWGRYELVNAPGDADLVFEISLDPGCSTKEWFCSTPTQYHFKLLLLDPKTHIVLQRVEESIAPFMRDKTGDNNAGNAIDKLLEDLKALTAQPAATPK